MSQISNAAEKVQMTMSALYSHPQTEFVFQSSTDKTVEQRTFYKILRLFNPQKAHTKKKTGERWKDVGLRIFFLKDTYAMENET
jgi:hypothetical protein